MEDGLEDNTCLQNQAIDSFSSYILHKSTIRFDEPFVKINSHHIIQLATCNYILKQVSHFQFRYFHCTFLLPCSISLNANSPKLFTQALNQISLELFLAIISLASNLNTRTNGFIVDKYPGRTYNFSLGTGVIVFLSRHDESICPFPRVLSSKRNKIRGIFPLGPRKFLVFRGTLTK